jgi:glycosyltransferase involved in cell wall biosynthesis
LMSRGLLLSGPMTSRPRVVVVAQAAPAQGGIATYAETIVDDPELRGSFEITLLNTTRRAVRRGGELSVANLWHALVDVVRVFRAARSADVVHIQTALLPLLPLLRALALCRSARIGGAAVLCHVHTGLANDGPNEAFRPSASERLLLRRFRFVHAVLTVSEAGTKGLRPHMPGVTVERVDNAIDVAAFVPARADGSGTILFVGTLAQRKGLLDLLEAAKRLRTQGLGGWRLEVVGAGNEAGDEEAERIRTAFRSEGMAEALVGPLDGEAVRERLRSAGIYALPSLSEGQPIGILEAMASGIPIVATRVGAIPDLVRDGEHGLLIDPGQPDELAEALEKLVASPELRRSMGTSARKRAEERFDLPALRQRLGELYREAARARSRPRR